MIALARLEQDTRNSVDAELEISPEYRHLLDAKRFVERVGGVQEALALLREWAEVEKGG